MMLPVIPWLALALYFGTAAFAAILTSCLVRWGDNIPIVDVPNPRSSHRQVKPRTGGIALLVSILAGYAAWQALTPSGVDTHASSGWIISGALAFFCVGLWDDIRPRSPWARLLLQLLISSIIAVFGPRLDALTLPVFGRLALPIGYAVPLTAFWYAGFVNVFNFMDGLDGFAAGEAALVGVLMAAVSGTTWPFLVSAAALGFLIYNWQPARIFMGDSGSYLLGYLLAVFSVLGSSGAGSAPFIVYALFLGTFLMDTAVTLVRRLLRGEPVVAAHRSHHYQIATNSGLSHSKVSSLNLVLTAALGVSGLIYVRCASNAQVTLLCSWFLVFAVLGTLIHTLEPLLDRRMTDEPGYGRPMRYTLGVKRLTIMLLDVMALTASYIAAFFLRFGLSPDPRFIILMEHTLPLAILAQLAAFLMFDLYRGLWRYASFSDLLNITKAVAVGSLMSCSVLLFTHRNDFPRTVLLNYPLLTFIAIGGVRFSIRFAKSLLARGTGQGAARRVLIFGAGDLGENLLRQMLKASQANYKVVGLIDDNPVKWGFRIHGFSVLGGRAILSQLLKDRGIDEIVIAVPSRRGSLVSSIMKIIREANHSVELKIAPSLEEMLMSPGSGVTLRKVLPADLLNRKTVQLDSERIHREFHGKTILVTGAGGTIGAELCRQVLSQGPRKILTLENHATSLFYIEAELKEKFKEIEVIPVLGDARDEALIERIFSAHRPQIVLHAAAHKHLSQLEGNIHEGVKNNVLATHALAEAAHRHQAEAFLLISTDKAVRPSSVMGMTKRVAEIVVHAFNAVSQTRFMSVRFGNVLGSSGSMLRIFQERIRKRQPLMITHSEATRYFMLVEEAVQLILQAISSGGGGETFILNMGTPMNILELAKNLILLSGLVPEKDIPLIVTGLRPGEKLHEELFDEQDQRMPTPHPDIFVSKTGEVDFAKVAQDVRILKELAFGEAETLVRRMRGIILQKEASVSDMLAGEEAKGFDFVPAGSQGIPAEGHG